MSQIGVLGSRSWWLKQLAVIVSMALGTEPIATATTSSVGASNRSHCLLHPLKQDCQTPGVAEFQSSTDQLCPRPINHLRVPIRVSGASKFLEIDLSEVSKDPQLLAQYWFIRGKELGQAGYFDEAADAFERSTIQAGPEFAATAWYNRALALDHGKDRLMAAVGFRDYLRYIDSLGDVGNDVANKVTPRAVVQSRIEELRPLLATLELRIVGHDPREIWVNGEQHRISDFPLWVPEGRVELWIIDQVGKKQRSAFHITLGETRQIEFESLRIPTTDESLARQNQMGIDEIENSFHRESSLHARNIDAKDRPWKSGERSDQVWSQKRIDRPILRILFWASGSAALATGAVAVFTATETLRYKKRFETSLFNSGKCAPNCDSSQIEPFPSQYEQPFYGFRRATNVLWGAALTIAMGTAILGYFSFRRPKQSQKTSNLRKKAWALSTN